MTTTYERIREAAKLASQAFVTDKRTNNGVEFRKLRDGSPQWMQDLCFAAHANGSMLPDDWRYEFIEAAVDAIADTESIEDARDSIEPDIYNGKLCAWLASNLNRIGYCDEAIEEFGEPQGGIVSIMSAGQLAEKWEVFDQVVAFLETHVENDTEDD